MILSERTTDESPFGRVVENVSARLANRASVNNRIVLHRSAYALSPLRKRRDGNSSSEVRFPWRPFRNFHPLPDAPAGVDPTRLGKNTTELYCPAGSTWPGDRRRIWVMSPARAASISPEPRAPPQLHAVRGDIRELALGAGDQRLTPEIAHPRPLQRLVMGPPPRPGRRASRASPAGRRRTARRNPARARSTGSPIPCSRRSSGGRRRHRPRCRCGCRFIGLRPAMRRVSPRSLNKPPPGRRRMSAIGSRPALARQSSRRASTRSPGSTAKEVPIWFHSQRFALRSGLRCHA